MEKVVSEEMTMEFSYETCAGAVHLGAYFLLLLLSKEREGHRGVAKAEQQFAVCENMMCSGRKSSSEGQREKEVASACYASCGSLRREEGWAGCL